jgi:hypothetical protein
MLRQSPVATQRCVIVWLARNTTHDIRIIFRASYSVEAMFGRSSNPAWNHFP